MAKCKYKYERILEPDYECPEQALPDSKEGYCIFHEPRKDKDIDKFNAGIEAKMDNRDCDFTGYYFPEDIDFSKYNEGKFERWARFDGAEFQGMASFEGAKFQDVASFKEAKFQGEASFDGAEFQELASFDGAEFQDRARFGEAEFRGYALFEAAEFQGTASFEGAKFEGWAGFERAKFQDVAGFERAEFHGKAWFEGAKFHGATSFEAAEFHDLTHFVRAKFQKMAAFSRAKFQAQASFEGAKFQRQSWFHTSEFARTASFRDAYFRFHSYAAEVAYRKAKISYQREGDYAEAGYYRLLEMRARRKARLERLKKDLETFKEESPAKKSVHIARVRFLQGLERVLIDWTCGYGEQWWRVIPAALTLVFGCALLYYFFFPITSPDIQITGIGWGYFKDCLYFSFVTFTTLGYGDLRPMPEVWTRAVASIEAFTGAFMIALFVLCFARKWMR